MNANVYHTLNDYRLSTEPVYENGAKSKLTAAVIVAALFLGVGTYFYYSKPTHVAPQNIEATPATEVSSPAATNDAANSTTPIDMQRATDLNALPSAAPAPVPLTAAPAARTSVPGTNGGIAAAPSSSNVNRTAPSKVPATSPQRAKPVAEPVNRTASPAVAAPTATATATPEPAVAEPTESTATPTPDLSVPATDGATEPLAPATTQPEAASATDAPTGG